MASIANDDTVAEEQEKAGVKKKSRRNKRRKMKVPPRRICRLRRSKSLEKSNRRKRGSQSNDAICADNLGTLVNSVLASRMVVVVSQGIVRKVKDQKFLRLIRRKIGGRKNVPARLILKVTK